MREDIKTYDVLIVGAGVVGRALALALSQQSCMQGKRIALLDLFPASYDATNPERVIALSQGSSRYLKSLGVWDTVAAFAVGEIKHIHVCESKNTGTVDMSHHEIQADALGYVVEIRHVLKALSQALPSNIELICPAQCVHFERKDTGVIVQIKQGDKLETIHSQLLVGADGTNSQVRQLAGIQTQGWDYNRMGLVATLTTAQAQRGVAYECFREEGPLALLPLPDSPTGQARFSLVWSVTPMRAVQLLKLADHDFMDALQKDMGHAICQDIGAWCDVGKRACFALELRCATSFAQAGIALVGNAAHTIHPVAGQGMNLGLRDVAVLVEVLCQDWAKDKLYHNMVAQTYAERRRLDTLAVIGFTQGMTTTFASSCLPLRWLRGLALSGLQRTPSLKQVLLQQASGLGKS